MKLKKAIKFLFVFFLFFFVFKENCLAGEGKYITIVNPVRGEEFWGEKPFTALDGARLEKELIDKYKLSATWLLRFDVLNSNALNSFFKEFPSEQEIGLFLEVTPLLAKAAEVSYPEGGIFWHDANKIFLSGYQSKDREKLIDAVFSKFKEIFGYYPKSVGAWHIDAYSADYMKQRYGITGLLICADQFGTDGYQIWGGWWGVPFYPSKRSILMPAQTQKNKLDLVVFWWAARDPKLGYGGSVNESTYSVQVNDYLSHGLGVSYFSDLLDIYLKNEENSFGQVTVGLENDNNWEKIGDGFELQLGEVKEREVNGVSVGTMANFSEWYRKRFKEISPVHRIDDWFMTPSYRLGLVEINGEKFIKDLRIFNEEWPEANLLTANPWGTLSLENPYKIDTVRFENSVVNFNFTIDKFNLIRKFGEQKVPFRVNSLLLLLFYSSTLLLLILFLRRNLPLLTLVLIGSTGLSLTMVKSGLVYDYGMGFWGPNGHDGIWHLALINQLARFSLDNPVFSGVKLTNYHFGFDFLAALLSRLTGIIPVRLYFQILPPILAVLIGILTYKFVVKWTNSKAKAWWATFFVYFGGSWGWLVSLWRSGYLGGESMFWANQSVSTLINPPFALSLIFMLLGLTRFYEYSKNQNSKNLILCALYFGLLLQIKVYAGIIVLLCLFSVFVFTSLHCRIEVLKYFKILVLTAGISLITFLPFNQKVSSLLVFSPLWFSRTMISFSDRFGWFKLESARTTYMASRQWAKWILAEGLALAIFILGNLGVRAVGFFYGGFIWRKKRETSVIEIFLFGALVVSLAIPLLFIQKGNSWNTIQFFYYFQFFMAIFLGMVIGKFWNKIERFSPKHIFIYVTSGLLILLTIPTMIASLKNDYLPNRPPARISVEELEALQFLRKQPLGIVLTYPYNKEWWSKFSEPRPLYAYETTAYVSALTGNVAYLEDEMNLEITGYDWKIRREESFRFFLTADIGWANKFIEENKIKYVYLVKGQKLNLGAGDIGGEKIFENGEVVIYKVN